MLLNISGGYDLTLHEVAEAARIIAESVDAEANIISGMVIDEELADEMKVTVIATGFDRAAERTEAPAEVRTAVEAWRPRPSLHGESEHAEPAQQAAPREPVVHEPVVREPAVREPAVREPAYREPGIRESAPAVTQEPMLPLTQPVAPPPAEQEPDIPFYRKVLAHRQADDPGGYGPNWSNVDDYDIPTVLRKQMD